jgi:hypothetical protein
VRPKALTRETFNLQAATPAIDVAPTSVTPPSAAAGAAATPVGFAAGGPPAGGVTSHTTSATEPEVQAAAGTAPDSGGGRRILALTAGGLAVVALAFGVVEHVRWQDKVDSFQAADSGCGDDLPDRGGSNCQQLYESGKLARTLTFVGYGAAAAFGLTATILYLTDPARDARTARIACAPTLHHPGAGCAFTF